MDDFSTVYQTYRSDTPYYETNNSQLPQDTDLAVNTVTHSKADHFLVEFGKEIVDIATVEEVDVELFMKLTETQLLRLKPGMSMKLQTGLLEHQRLLKEKLKPASHPFTERGNNSSGTSSSVGSSSTTNNPLLFQYRGGYTYNSQSILVSTYGDKVIEDMMGTDCDKATFEREYRRKVIRLHCLALMEMTEKRFPGRVPTPTNTDKRELAAHLTTTFPALACDPNENGVNYGHLFHTKPQQGGAIDYCIKNLKFGIRKRQRVPEPTDTQTSAPEEKTLREDPQVASGDIQDDLKKLKELYVLDDDSRHVLERTHKQRRERIAVEKLHMGEISQHFAFLSRAIEIVEFEFLLLIGKKDLSQVADELTSMIMDMSLKKGDSIRTLIELALPGQMAKNRDGLIDNRAPADIIIDSSQGHIAMTKFGLTYYVVYPTGEIFLFNTQEHAWLFYVKSTYVFSCDYLSPAHKLVCGFIERLLKVPAPLLTPLTNNQKRLLSKIKHHVRRAEQVD